MMYVPEWRPEQGREFVVTGFQVLLQAGVSSSVENANERASLEDSGHETSEESRRTVTRCLLGDQEEEMSCFFSFFFVRCINNIIKAWDEVWALGTGSQDDFPN